MLSNAEKMMISGLVIWGLVYIEWRKIMANICDLVWKQLWKVMHMDKIMLDFVTMKDTEWRKIWKKAISYYKLSVAQGCAAAQNNLANVYLNGDRVPKDTKEAARLYILAAEQGEPYAHLHLARLFFHGDGVPKNLHKAIKHLIFAAESGLTIAQNRIGNCYEFGWGVPQSRDLTLYWYQRAASQGDPVGVSNVARIISEK